ncbi:MAG: LysE family translocator [Myxococcota bacterium]
MMNDTVLALALFALVASITPGPNNLMLLASGTNYGFRRTVPHLLGVNIGFTLMLILVGTGVMQIFRVFPPAFLVLKVFAFAYLLYLAYRIATATPGFDSTEPDARRPFSFLEAALFQWVNPKAWTMALTANTTFAAEPGSATGIALVAAVFMVMNLPSISLWAVVGVYIRALLARPALARAFNVVAAALLLGSLYPMVVATVPEAF